MEGVRAWTHAQLIPGFKFLQTHCTGLLEQTNQTHASFWRTLEVQVTIEVAKKSLFN